MRDIDYNNLKCIRPDKILNISNSGIFLTLALISNDLGDLIYLQGLHAKNTISIKDLISAENGQKTGRNIYIFRLALSHMYSIFEFINKRIDLIEKDDLFNKILKENLSKEERFFWDFVVKISKNFKSFRKKDFLIDGISEDYLEIVRLTEIARNDVTFHYDGTIKHLKKGFVTAFGSNKLPNTEYAFITEMNDVGKDRKYYIDISLQKFLENEANLGKNLFDSESPFVVFISSFNRVTNKILQGFHSNLGFEKVQNK